jgi:hypothetical protein
MFRNKSLSIFLFILCTTCVQIIFAQEIRVIDNKGTLKTANNNRVTSSATSPTLPLEGDVWFDNTDVNNIITKIYDGTSWLLVNTKVNKLQDADGDTTVEVEKNADEDIIRFQTFGTERMFINKLGNVAIGNSNPYAQAILDLTNTQKFAFLLPSETDTSEIATPTDGMLLYASAKNNAYLRTDNTWKPIAFNAVSNELIFDGDDDADNTNDNFRYVSLVVNGKWKVIRFDKTDVNVEDIANQTTNPSQTTQPTTLAECTALTY